MNHKKQSKNKAPLMGIIVISFAFFAVFGLSLITGNQQDSGVGSSQASAQEPADINNDNKVDVFDLSILLSKWGTNNTTSDLNKDGITNVFDLSILLSKWGAVTTANTIPNSNNTGVPNGVSLRSLSSAYPDASAKGYSINAQGRATITKDNEIYDGVIFPQGVWIKAKNITIRNSRIEGSRSSFSGLPDEPNSWAECRSIRTSLEAANKSTPSVFTVDANSSTVSNFILEDSEIVATGYSIYISSFMGHDTTMRRVDISGGVDGIGTHNGYSSNVNITIEDSYIHDLYRGKWSVGNYNVAPGTTARMYCGYDANHPEPTHNDGIQMHDGANITITGNYINPKPVNHSQANAGIMMNNAGNVLVDNNRFEYGVCSINLVSGLGLPITVSNNTFYGNNGSSGTGGQDDNGCAIIRPSSAGYIFNNNLWDNGNTIRLTNG